MNVVHLLARIALGVVFVAAGASKVAGRRAWPSQAAQLGVPGGVAAVLPWFELVVGALVATGVGQPTTVLIAVVTLVAFTTVLVHNLRIGRRPPCACFGTWGAATLGWGHVARNVAFVAVGVLATVTR